MPFRAAGEDEYTGTKFALASPDSYRVRVDRYEIVEDQKTKYNPEGNPRVRFFLTPIEIDGDPEAEMVDTEDKPLDEEKQFLFFFDPDHLGTKPRVARSRKFIASALNIPTEQAVEWESLEEFCEDMLDRELVVDVDIKGEYNNISDTRPVRKRTRKRAERPSLVEAAEQVFNEDPPEDSSPEEAY